MDLELAQPGVADDAEKFEVCVDPVLTANQLGLLWVFVLVGVNNETVLVHAFLKCCQRSCERSELFRDLFAA